MISAEHINLRMIDRSLNMLAEIRPSEMISAQQETRGLAANAAAKSIRMAAYICAESRFFWSIGAKTSRRKMDKLIGEQGRA